MNTVNGRIGDWRKTGNDWGMNTLSYVRMQDAGWSVGKLSRKRDRQPAVLPSYLDWGGCQTALRYRLAKAAWLPQAGFPPQSKTISGGKLRPFPASGRLAGRYGLTGLAGLESVWERFTKCGFWGKKGQKIGLHGLERFTAGGRVNRFLQACPHPSAFCGCGVVGTSSQARKLQWSCRFARRFCRFFRGGVGKDPLENGAPGSFHTFRVAGVAAGRRPARRENGFTRPIAGQQKPSLNSENHLAV